MSICLVTDRLDNNMELESFSKSYIYLEKDIICILRNTKYKSYKNQWFFFSTKPWSSRQWYDHPLERDQINVSALSAKHPSQTASFCCIGVESGKGTITLWTAIMRHWVLLETGIVIHISSGNVKSPDKRQTNHPNRHISIKIWDFRSRNCIWRCHLRRGGYSLQTALWLADFGA